MTPPTPPPRDKYHVTGEGLGTEVRVFFRYVFALTRPGARVPVFGKAEPSERSVTSKDDDEQALLLEEARAQRAGQNDAMQNNQTRAATLLTVTVAELIYLVKVASNILDRSQGPVIALWGVALVFAFLGLAGTAAVLTTSAEYGGVDLIQVIDSDKPVLEELTTRYVRSLDSGARTNAARLTVLRDAVWLAAVAGLLLMATVPFSADKADDKTCKVPQGFACVRPTPMSTGTMSPNASATSTPTSAPVSTSPTTGASSRPTPTPTPVKTPGATAHP